MHVIILLVTKTVICSSRCPCCRSRCECCCQRRGFLAWRRSRTGTGRWTGTSEKPCGSATPWNSQQPGGGCIGEWMRWGSSVAIWCRSNSFPANAITSSQQQAGRGCSGRQSSTDRHTNASSAVTVLVANNVDKHYIHAWMHTHIHTHGHTRAQNTEHAHMHAYI